MEFNHTLRQRWVERDGSYEMDMPGGWMQGRAVFGGLTVASAASLAFRALERAEAGSTRQLRTVSAQLLRPPKTGSTNGTARVLRSGKSAAFVESRLAQNGVDVALVTSVFVTPRDDSQIVTPPAPFSEPPVDTLSEMPYVPDLTPEFTQHLAFRWASGGIPFSGAEHARFNGYVRFRGKAGDAEGVLGLLDAWPCPTLGVLNSPAFASTVNWTAHLIRVPENFDAWFSFEYETVVGQDGFHTAVGRLFGPDRSLVGWTEQLCAVYD